MLSHAFFTTAKTIHFQCKRRNLTCVVVAAAILLTHLVQFEDAIAAEPKEKAPRPASEADILLVELRSNANRDNFNELLQDVHGTVIRTLEFGPTFKVLVIQTEPGTSAKVAGKLKSSKDVAEVESNAVLEADDDLNDAVLPEIPGPRPPRFGGGRRMPDGPGQPGGPGPVQPIGNAQIPNDPLYPDQWALNAMKFEYGICNPQAGTMTAYILDTGCAQNPDLDVTQYNCAGMNPPGTGENTHDTGRHGTSCTTPFCITNNKEGYAGLANPGPVPQTKCIELRISNNGKTTTQLNIFAALNWIYNQPNLPAGPINVSWGFKPPNTLNGNLLFQYMCYLLALRGFKVIVAAGNSGKKDPTPELYAARIGAVDQDLNRAKFSVYGPFDTAAPGANIAVYKDANTDAPVFVNGTSCAAPLWCAAIIYVMFFLPPARRNAPLAHWILRTTATVTPAGWRVPNLHDARMAALQFK